MIDFNKLTKKEIYKLRDNLFLTQRQLMVFTLKIERGISLDSIADELNVSYSTVAHESSIIRKKIDNYVKSD